MGAAVHCAVRYRGSDSLVEDAMNAAAGTVRGTTTGVWSPHAAPHGDGHHSVNFSKAPVSGEGGTSPYGGSAGVAAGGVTTRCVRYTLTVIPRDSGATGVLSGSPPGCRVNPANGESRGKFMSSLRGAAPEMGGGAVCYFS